MTGAHPRAGAAGRTGRVSSNGISTGIGTITAIIGAITGATTASPDRLPACHEHLKAAGSPASAED